MEAGSGIRKSAYEPGLWFVPAEPGTTLQDHGTQWQIGARYSLVRVLGYGSFSSVCLAVDEATGEQVALKRVADVLQSPEHTRRVLREVCILRRLRHPNLIAIRDAFVRPSATGQCRLRGGKLVNLSVDVYIALELAAGGDLFHLRGHLTGGEVRSLMWQLIVTLRYLHSLHVWHRDMKSQNVFLSWENGERVVKVGDFGSARSATPGGYPWAEQSAPSAAGTLELAPSQAAGAPAALHAADSYAAMDAAIQRQDLYAQPESGTGEGGGRAGFKAPLTRVVATPCYRAPEVVMSRGGYTAAIDMWSLGCIFGELLQRIAHVGSAATPNLQVAPLFAIHGLPTTPGDGDSFVGGPGSELTRSELQALFSVTGTPCWADVAAVQEPSWRRYLHHLPGRAPTLYRRFSAAGEAAVDLLARLLAFDPTRRCSPEEALAHEYFADASNGGAGGVDDGVASGQLLPGSRWSDAAAAAASQASHLEGAAGAAEGQEEAMDAGPEPATPLSALQPYSVTACGVPVARAEQAAAAAQHAAAAARHAAAAAAVVQQHGGDAVGSALAGPFADRLHVGSPAEALASQQPAPHRASPFSTPPDRCAGAGGGGQAAAGRAGGRGGRRARYWEESDPGRALAMLEEELSAITANYSTASPEDEGSQMLRRLLEEECEAIQAAQAAAPEGSGGTPAPRHDGDPASGTKRARLPQGGGGESGILSSLLKRRDGGLQEDTAGQLDADSFAAQRLSNVADTWQGRELDPSRILGAQRHGEWFRSLPAQGPAAGPAWGVTVLPPGSDESKLDPQLLAVMRAQQGR